MTERTPSRTSDPESSLYEWMLSDPEARDAFFNTTQAQLFADPGRPETREVKAALELASVAFLFTPFESEDRPVLQTEHGQFFGSAEILGAIATHWSRSDVDAA